MSEVIKNKMVVYSDGSSKPNPGFIGYGFHGYTYTDDVPKKNYGGKGYKLTSYGYAIKTKDNEDKEPAVTPIEVFDGIGSSTDTATNNTAEVLGLKEALKLADSQNVSHLLVKTDSEYARRGYVEWLDKWAKNNWMNREGKYIANMQSWKDVYQIKQELEAKKIDVQVEWVKGHVGFPGNEKADKLANIGRVNSEAKRQSVDLHRYAADDYWSRNMSAEKHPLICKPWMYFRGLANGQIPGEYYFGNIGKDEDFLGKRDANGGYSIVQLKVTDPLLDKVKKIQIEKSGSDNTIYVVNLRALYSGDRCSDLMDYGASTLIQVNPRRRDLYFIDSASLLDHNGEKNYNFDEEIKEAEDTGSEDDETNDSVVKTEPLTREQRPQKLSARVFDCLTFMKEKLEDYKASNERHNKYYDITQEFYQVESKLVKKEYQEQYKLRPEFKVGVISKEFTIEYEGKKLPIRLNLTIDAPDRNCLKRLETYSPKIVLIVWKESDTAIRYATVVECKDATSIWAGFYSNLIFLSTAQ